MAKELSKEDLEMAKKLVKSDMIFEEMADGDLDEVSGGFRSKEGYTAGRKIKCPSCGTKKRDNIDYRGEYDFSYESGGSDLFYCNKCGTMFAVDEKGHVMETP